MDPHPKVLFPVHPRHEGLDGRRGTRHRGKQKRVDTAEEVEPAIEKANEIDDRPVVIDFRTDYREKVYPMVAAGTSNDDVILDPAHDRPGGRD